MLTSRKAEGSMKRDGRNESRKEERNRRRKADTVKQTKMANTGKCLCMFQQSC